MINDLKCLIKTYDDVIPESYCKSLIEKYEANVDKIEFKVIKSFASRKIATLNTQKR